MNQNKKISTIALSIAVTTFFIVAIRILFPMIEKELYTGWVRTEFYTVLTINVLFCAALSFYLYKNILSRHWTQRYLVNTGIVVSLILYYIGSHSNETSIPVLGGVTLMIILYIIPGLVVVQSIAFLINRLLSAKAFK